MFSPGHRRQWLLLPTFYLFFNWSPYAEHEGPSVRRRRLRPRCFPINRRNNGSPRSAVNRQQSFNENIALTAGFFIIIFTSIVFSHGVRACARCQSLKRATGGERRGVHDLILKYSDEMSCRYFCRLYVDYAGVHRRFGVLYTAIVIVRM